MSARSKKPFSGLSLHKLKKMRREGKRVWSKDQLAAISARISEKEKRKK